MTAAAAAWAAALAALAAAAAALDAASPSRGMVGGIVDPAVQKGTTLTLQYRREQLYSAEEQLFSFERTKIECILSFQNHLFLGAEDLDYLAEGSDAQTQIV